MINIITMEFTNTTLKKAVELWIKNKEKAIIKYGHISEWNTSNVTDMSYLFFNVHEFNQDIGKWNTSNVTDMKCMFYGAYDFNQDIGNWSTDNVTNMSYMFNYARAFNCDISKWSTHNVTDMHGMFHNAIVFNQDITNWDISNVYSMDFMFGGAKSFNQDIRLLNLSNVPAKNWIINGTLLSTRLEGSKWTNNEIMNKLFPYSRRKHFLMFLIKCKYIPYKQNYTEIIYHKIFSTEDIYKSIMSYI